jgi:two-component system sensor histidine kinase YesM
MVQRIDELGAARERSERERLAVELDALRYQINPHFVANTLNAIRFMALAAHADAIAGMTRDLTRLLADSYAGAEKLVDLSRELDNVKAYAGIMKVRYGERFALAFDVADGTDHLLSLRMILQPIVENAILHGLAPTAPQPGRGVVRIRTWVEATPDAPIPLPTEPWARAVAGRALMIEVHDDGRGMEPGLPARLLDEPAQANGLYRIGVANVHRRIRLNFGEPYGLCIDSEPGAYTAVRYRLPVFERVDAGEPPHA